MRLIRLMTALLALGTAACGTTRGDMQMASLPLTIDQPSSPFPYNSRICP